jgi:phytoene desaturase
MLRDEPLAKPNADALAKRKQTMSLFLIYFGTDKKYPNPCHHTVLFGPRYKGLLTDIFDRGVLADDFSLYLHAPTVTDPTMAPPGHEGFYVLAPVPHLGQAALDWEKIGPAYADKILGYLEAKLLPGLKKHLVTQRIFTPLDFEQQLRAYQGNAFSIQPLLTQSAYFRTHNRDPRIKGLYFVGAGTHPGAGVPGVVNSAKATHRLIQDDFAMYHNLVRRSATSSTARPRPLPETNL